MPKISCFIKISLVAFLCAFFLIPTLAEEIEPVQFRGNGTQNDPYQIASYEDLCLLRDLVNRGVTFENYFFAQTADIDMKHEDWTPIGIFGKKHYFFGVYDGNGHSLENLNVGTRVSNKEKDNNGLFGVLGGIVVNLGVKSGSVYGNCCGAIASHATGSSAAIINCYSNVNVTGNRAGGIADNFSNGRILNCWSIGKLKGKQTGGIVSYNAALVENCIGVYKPVSEDFQGRLNGCSVFGSDINDLELFAEKLNNGLLRAAGCVQRRPLLKWEVVDGIVVFSNATFDLGEFIPFWGSGTEEDPFLITNAQDFLRYQDLIAAGLSKQFQNYALTEHLGMLKGSGTKRNPYRIESYSDLCLFRDLVFFGNTFQGQYVLQTKDIDMQNESWIPIGCYGSRNYFYGVYDGGGHTISNLLIEPGTLISANNGFFGTLGGKVVNFGIESGSIQGAYCGAIASHATGGSAAIVNCYSKASVTGNRAGGIADNFSGGVIVCAWSTGKVHGQQTGGIVSYNATTIYACYATSPPVSSSFEGTRVKCSSILEPSDQLVEYLNDALLMAAACIDHDLPHYWKWDGDVSLSNRSFQTKDYIPFDGDGTKTDPYQLNNVEDLLLYQKLKNAGLNQKSIHFKFMHSVEDFHGSGTKEDPYQINNLEDLSMLRDLVYYGESFDDIYFLQTANIDMKNTSWVPIGVCETGNYFYGIYDGGGHYVENLRVRPDGVGNANNNGFFGALAGTVANFGIESGSVRGQCSGGIASASVDRNAAIINCYNKASVSGVRAGGIADNFADGEIICSWSSGTLQGDTTGGILSFGGDVKLYYCYTNSESVAPADVSRTTSGIVTENEMNSDVFARKLSVKTALAQYLFANAKNIGVLQWEISKGQLTFSSSSQYIRILWFLNYYMLPVLLMILLIFFAIRCAQVGKSKIWIHFRKQIVAIALVSGIVAVFFDTALYAKGFSYLNLGNGTFCVLVNLIFVGTAGYAIKHSIAKPHFSIQWLPIAIVILVSLVLEVTQMRIVPKFDAHLYYGSFVKAVGEFNLDLLTYIGAFVCWKWAQGLVLLLGPLEFLLTGKIIGVYISNMVITVVTLCCLYWLLRQLFVKITPLVAALSCAVFMLCPYTLGMFTYLCMDCHTAFFLVWLLCSYKKKNNVLISFCGYLLAFNKITGLVFYTFFLITMTVLELAHEKGKPLFRRIRDWWDWGKVILWVLPALLFLGSYFYGDQFIIQSFYGTYAEASMGIKDARGLGNTFLDGFIFGLRWVFVLAYIGVVILLVRKRRVLKEAVTDGGMTYMISSAFGCLGVLFLLCIYRGDAECPRYTALFNLFYALSFPMVVLTVFRKEILRRVACCSMVTLLLIQTYWTIDPSILIATESVNTGQVQLHKLALPNDPRRAMNLGIEVGEKSVVIGDLYAYNIEYNYNDNLLDQILEDIKPTEKDVFYVLDLITYEFHLSGSRYPIYWNTRLNTRTYDKNDADSIFLEQNQLLTETLCTQVKAEFGLPDHFYLLVAARVDSTEALTQLEDAGYRIDYSFSPKNVYGSMRVYGFTRANQNRDDDLCKDLRSAGL